MERQLVVPSRPRRDAMRPGRRRAAAPVEVLLRGAGNAAVSRMLQRYEAGEHATQGDKTPGSQKVTIGGETLTSGEINALADLYGSPDELMKANPAEVKAVVALVRRQASGGKVSEAEWDKATGGRYTQLNLKNSPHFAPRDPAIIKPLPGAPAGPDHRAKFLELYAETIRRAQLAFDPSGTGVCPVVEPDAAHKKKMLDQAAVVAGFAEHYIMDAFSAGHLFNKDDFIAQLKENLDKLPPAKVTALFKTVAQGVLADAGSKKLLGTYEPTGMTIAPNLDKEFVFKGLLEKMYADPEGKQAVYSALVKVVHDELSTRAAGGGLVGVEVENKFEKWILSGDKTLDKSPKTQEIIGKAIEQFRKLVEPYRAGIKPIPSATPDADKVLDFFPRPTAASVKLISDLVTKVVDAGTGTTDALISIIKAELDAILKGLESKGHIKKA
jgi:hypothetical protein